MIIMFISTVSVTGFEPRRRYTSGVSVSTLPESLRTAGLS